MIGGHWVSKGLRSRWGRQEAVIEMTIVCEDWWEVYLKGGLICQLDCFAEEYQSTRYRTLPQLEPRSLSHALNRRDHFYWSLNNRRDSDYKNCRCASTLSFALEVIYFSLTQRLCDVQDLPKSIRTQAKDPVDNL